MTEKFSKERFLTFVNEAKTWGEYISDNMRLVYDVTWEFKFNHIAYKTCIYEVEFEEGKLYLVDTVGPGEVLTDYFDALIFNTFEDALDFVERDSQNKNKEILVRWP